MIVNVGRFQGPRQRYLDECTGCEARILELRVWRVGLAVVVVLFPRT